MEWFYYSISHHWNQCLFSASQQKVHHKVMDFPYDAKLVLLGTSIDTLDRLLDALDSILRVRMGTEELWWLVAAS